MRKEEGGRAQVVMNERQRGKRVRERVIDTWRRRIHRSIYMKPVSAGFKSAGEGHLKKEQARLPEA
jgi:hypothetical protein